MSTTQSQSGIGPMTMDPPTGGCSHDTPIFVGKLFVIPQIDVSAAEAAAGRKMSAIATGVHTLNAETGDGWGNGDLIYWDANNSRATANPNAGDFIGTSFGVKASSAGTHTVRLAGGPSPELVNDTDDGDIAHVATLRKSFSGAGTVNLFPNGAPRNYRVTGGYIVRTGTTAGTAKLTDGTNDISDTATLGTTDKAVIEFATIDDAYWDLSQGDDLDLVVATGGEGEVFVNLLPIG